MTGEKAIGVVTQKKIKGKPFNYIVYGIYCERELIWIDSLRELEVLTFKHDNCKLKHNNI